MPKKEIIELPKLSLPKYVPGTGSPVAKLMVVGEAPGADEESKGEPFVGMTGKEVQKLLQFAGLSWSEVYRSNVVKHRPPGNNLKNLIQYNKTIEDYYPQLYEEIKTIKPNAILALGGTALQALTGKSGITKHRGSILPCSFSGAKPKVIAAFHPSAYLSERGGEGSVPYSARTYTLLDFKKAIKESYTSDFNLPVRSLNVCRSSNQLYHYFRQNQDKTRLSIDIEVIKSLPICIGMAFSKSNALSVPLFNVMDMEKNPIPDAELVEVWKILARELEDPRLQIIGQNFKFDHEKIRNTIGIRLKNIWFDTMIACHVLHPELPKSLEWSVSVYTDEPYYKDEYREFNPKKDKIDQVFLYNAKDAAVTYEVMEATLAEMEELGLTDVFFNLQMPMHEIYRKMEADGFYLDKDMQAFLIEKYAKLEKEANAFLVDKLGGPINVHSNGSAGQVMKALMKMGFPLRSSVDEDSLSALYANHAKTEEQKNFINAILYERRYHRTAQVAASLPDYDGRMKSSYNMVGTETGRTATRLMKPPVRPEKIGLSFHNLTKHGDIGEDLRKMLKPDPGWELLNADLSQAEPRIVANLSEDFELLGKFGVTDIHKETAGWFFGLSNDAAQALDKEDPKRFIGKVGRNGGNYDMGKKRLALTINTDAKKYHIDVQVSEYQAGKILDIFHGKSPKIRNVFHRGIREAIDQNNRIIICPSGARRQFLGRPGDELYKEGYAYIPQRTVGDKIKKVMQRCSKEGIRLIVEAHDAIVAMIRPNDRKAAAEIIRDEGEKPISFELCSLKRPDLIIPMEFEVGDNYKELVRYRL